MELQSHTDWAEEKPECAATPGGMNDLSWGLSISCPDTWIMSNHPQRIFNWSWAPFQSVQEKKPDCSFCQLLWCKHFPLGQFQVISMIRQRCPWSALPGPRESWLLMGNRSIAEDSAGMTQRSKPPPGWASWGLSVEWRLTWGRGPRKRMA